MRKIQSKHIFWIHQIPLKKIRFLSLVLITVVLICMRVLISTSCTSIIKVEDSRISQSSICENNYNVVRIEFLQSRPFCMHLSSNSIISNEISMNGSWEPQTTKFISLLLSKSSSVPRIFLDIGANIGWYTLVMSAFGHHVISIEPLTTNIELLKHSVQMSKVSRNVLVYPHALGTTIHKCILISDDENVDDTQTICGDGVNIGLNYRIPKGYSIKQTIYLTRLDSLVRQNIDVLKIDVQGYELFALESGDRLFTHHLVQNVISSFSVDNLRKKGSNPYEYLKFFISRGYDVRVLAENMGDLYERDAWHSIQVYRTEQDLYELIEQNPQATLWFTRNHVF